MRLLPFIDKARKQNQVVIDAELLADEAIMPRSMWSMTRAMTGLCNVEQVPQGEMAISAGMKVQASDDHTIGKLDELLLDPQSGAITSLADARRTPLGQKGCVYSYS